MKKGKIAWAIGIVIFLLAGMVSVGFTAEQAKFKLRLQSHLIPDDTKRGLTKFAEAVNVMSGGSIEISLFGVGAIVPMKETLDAVGRGALDMAQYPEGFWYKTVPVSEVGMGIPFLFRDLEEAKYFMYHKGYVNLLREAYAKHNVYVIPYECYPIGLMTKKPINKVEDLKGMKLRAFGTMADWLGEFKASTVSIPGGELYTALATGVVQGAHWGDAGPMHMMKFQEVLKNYMKPEPVMGGWNNLIVNMDLWKKFTPEQKMVIQTAAYAYGMYYNTNDTRILATKYLNDMVRNWQVKVVTVPPAEIEKMRKASQKLQENMAKKDPLSAKAIALLREYMKELGYEK